MFRRDKVDIVTAAKVLKLDHPLGYLLRSQSKTVRFMGYVPILL